MQNNRILIADDEAGIGEIISEVAEDLGFEPTLVQEGDKVVAQVASDDPAVIVLDLRMPGADGVEILQELAKAACTASIVLISGMDQRTLNTVESLGKEKNLNIVGTLTKPMHPDQIEGVLAPLARSSQASEEQFVERRSGGTGPDNYYGPRIYFSPQEMLGEGEAVQRVALEMAWRLDNGEEMHGEELFQWSNRQQIGKGLLSLMMEEAFRQWQNLGDSGRNFQFMLPLNSEMLGDHSMIALIGDIAKQFGFPPENLIIETDEFGIHASGSSAIEALSRLRIAGFRTAFITKSDNDELLTMLDKLPMDEIVVDMSSLQGKQGFESNMELEFSYSSMTSMARRKQIKTSARGVSSMHIAEFVKRCQFDWAEGPEIAEQSPIAELAQYGN